ncbi:MAG: hypothetical protein LBS57_03695 [Treponema sp.]|jgi:hypothetical protein|nr:hypothetical protein [Treponema sp.]
MAIQDNPYQADLLALYKEMEAAPMSIENYAAKLAKITDKQILTGEVDQGIPVATSGGPSSQTGKTTDKGKVI